MKPNPSKFESKSYKTVYSVVSNSERLDDEMKSHVVSALPKVDKCLHEDQLNVTDLALGTLGHLAALSVNREILSILSNIHTLAVEKCCMQCDNFECGEREVKEVDTSV